MRRRYIIDINADPVWGWNDEDSPEDMRALIERWSLETVAHYHPAVTFVGIVPDPHAADWAGYDHHGNDRSGHMHLHPEGTHERSDGKRGFYCVAPTENGRCIDPTPAYLQALQNNINLEATNA